MFTTFTRPLASVLLLTAIGSAASLADTSVVPHHENPIEAEPTHDGAPVMLRGQVTPQARPQTNVTPPVAQAQPVPAPVTAAPAVRPNPLHTRPVAPAASVVSVTDAGAAPEVPQETATRLPATRTTTLHYPQPGTTQSQGYVVKSTIVSPFTQGRSITDATIGQPVGPWIQFGVGATGLSDASLADLDLIGHQLRPYIGNPNVRFLVTGYTDTSGSASTNRRIATVRAANVKALLSQRFGIPASRFIIRGAGEDVATRSAHPRADLHRRVTVAILDGPVSYPVPVPLPDEPCALPANRYGDTHVRGRLVASTFDSIDDYGGGRLSVYCEITSN